MLKSQFLILRVLLICTVTLLSGSIPQKVEISKARPLQSNYEFSDIERYFNESLITTLERNLSSSSCPGLAIAVCKDGHFIIDTVFGVKSLATQMPIDKNTIFRLGSVSKGFAGLLASKLVELGYFHPDDPVSKYVPNLTLKAKSKDGVLKITHLLSQSVGVTEHAYSNLVDQNLSLDAILPYINRLYVRDSTGIAYAYQNATFGLIEKVIESATGMSYKDAMQTFILSPLSMTQTSMTMSGIIESHNYCNGHKGARSPRGFAPIDVSPHYYNVVSAGGVNSSLEDMKTWLTAVMGYRPDVLSETVRARAFHPYVWSGSAMKYFNKWPAFTGSYYGWGWRRIQVQNKNIVHHGGLVNGFRTEIAFDQDSNIGIVCLFNSTCNYSNNIVSDMFQAWEHSLLQYSLKEVPPVASLLKPIPIVSANTP